jgi:DNA-binding MarR family transcriptional regulator
MPHTPEGNKFTSLLLEVFKLNGLLILEGDRITKELKLSSARWKVLGALAEKNDSMTVPAIAKKMGQTRQAVQRLANEMVRDNLLLFQNNPNHKRAQLLNLTDKGKETFKKLEKKQMPWVNSIAKGFSEAELQQALTTLQKLIDNLQT